MIAYDIYLSLSDLLHLLGWSLVAFMLGTFFIMSGSVASNMVCLLPMTRKSDRPGGPSALCCLRKNRCRPVCRALIPSVWERKPWHWGSNGFYLFHSMIQQGKIKHCLYVVSPCCVSVECKMLSGQGMGTLRWNLSSRASEAAVSEGRAQGPHRLCHAYVRLCA